MPPDLPLRTPSIIVKGIIVQDQSVILMSEKYEDDPDVALMLRVSMGDRIAFESLVSKFQRSVINTAYRYTGNPSVAEELAQDVFVRMYRAAPAYKPEARFSTWLFTIVRNVCANYRERQGRFDRQMDPEADAYLTMQDADNPQDGLIRQEREKRIRNAVNSLPDSLRMPLVLHQFNHMAYDEVARVLQISLSAVKVRIHRARTALMEQLKDL